MHLLFARHGQSEANVQKLFINDSPGYGLTELGRQQAGELAAALLPESLTDIYASPLQRAQETAGIIHGALDLPREVKTSEALREFSVGNHEGSCEAEAWEEYRDVERRWLEEGDLTARIGGGECFEDIRKRFLPFIEEVLGTHSKDDRVLLV